MSQASLAFQETTAGKAAAGAGVTAPLSIPVPARPAGPEINLPGLGTIGKLPKLDFGLELLYGASEAKGVREELNKSEPSDLQIRGIVKYKFNN